VGSQGRRRLSGAGRGTPVSLTEDPTEATERQWQHCRQCRPDGWRRGAREPGQRLSGGPARRFRGILQCDCYSAYGTHPAITLAACWAHPRRKFHEALQTRKTLATGPLKAIARLYKVEKDLRQSRAGPEQRAA
jgi:hypothetical protein